jgi:endonuclease/exonuclease/phosphatase family metal-dependent hydrolase
MRASRDEGAPESRLGHALDDRDVDVLRGVRRRRDLERCEAWHRTRQTIEALTHGLEIGRPREPSPRPERRSFRAVTWNIERGNHLDAILAFLAQEPRITGADALLLNEVDIGMARSGNRNVAAELAERLGFEYAFGASYFCLSHGDVRDAATGERNTVGLHGNAILSRYPIVRAENVDTYVTRDKFESSEKRLGNKKALWAEVGAPFGNIALVSAHLDPYASPAQRGRQMRDILDNVQAHALGPAVLLGGDLNSNTYDLESLVGLAKNLAQKVVRGGFPHAIEHYMRPHELYERPTFDALREHAFDVEAFNDMARGSVRYEVGSFDSESKVREHLPEVFVRILRHKLAPWGGSVPLKVDWFAGRGLSPLGEGEIVEPDGRVSLRPTILERARRGAPWLSDHDPVVVDVRPAS